MYGKQWTENYGDLPNQAWKDALNTLTPARIHTTVMVCREAGDKYCINLPQFMARAKDDSLHRPKGHSDYKSLPTPQTTSSLRSIALKGETAEQYQIARAKAIAAGISLYAFKWERLKQNGWTMEKEKSFHARAASLGINIYGKGPRLDEEETQTGAAF